MQAIAVINHSMRLSNADAALAAAACSTQLRLHVAPVWRRQPMPVHYLTPTTTVPAGSYMIGIFDDSDQAGALGWHTEGPDGQVYGKVFVAPVLDHGGTPLQGALTVAAVLSHEVIEAFVDPAINAWCENSDGLLYALEAGDPVESDSYDITVGKNAVSVSNFALPAWFDPQAPGPYDHLGKLSKPFTMTSGGYVVYIHGGAEHQKFGEQYPAWKLEEKKHPASRTARRVAEVTP